MADETFYALSGITTAMREDGTDVQIAMTTAGGPTARLYVDFPTLGKLIRYLRSTAREMAERLEASETSDEFSPADSGGEVSRVLSMQAGITEADRELELLIQDEDGEVSKFRIPTDAAEALHETLGKVLPKLSEHSKAASQH